MRVGQHINKIDRNTGQSFGLQYKYVYGRRNNQAMVWDRHTGEIVFIAPRVPRGWWQGLADHQAAAECERLCAQQFDPGATRLPVDTAAIDSTP